MRRLSARSAPAPQSPVYRQNGSALGALPRRLSGGGVAAIVPAAGSGKRFGLKANKLFLELEGEPLLLHTFRALDESPLIRWIVPVVRMEDRRQIEAMIRRWHLTKVVAPCLGGASRASSVAKGVLALPKEAAWVLVHDGARPCLSRALIARAIQAARRFGAIACGLPANLTVKAVDERQEVRLTLDREQLWFVQTPQVFRRDWLERSLRQASSCLDSFPDDAAVMEWAGFPVRMIPGDPLNVKVTTSEDLLLAQAILKSRNRLGGRAANEAISTQQLAHSTQKQRESLFGSSAVARQQ